MPRAHEQHLHTIAAKLRARGDDPHAALAGLAGGELVAGVDLLLRALQLVLEALGYERASEILERLSPRS